MIHNLFKYLNYFNPTSHGRLFVTELAHRMGAVPQDGVFTIESGLKMELDMKDYVERSIFFYAYEFLCTKIIMAHLKPGGVFIDIGANVGYYSIKAFHRLGPNGRVLAIEPNPVVARRLKRNITLSKADAIELYEVALTDREGEVTLFCPTEATHGLASIRNQGWDSWVEHKVLAQRLDDLLPEDLPKPDLIKIDVEGAELLVFKGAAETIRKHRPPILLELNPQAAGKFGYAPLAVVRLLLEYNPGYRLHLIMEHAVTESSIEELERRKMAAANLLLEPQV